MYIFLPQCLPFNNIKFSISLSMNSSTISDVVSLSFFLCCSCPFALYFYFIFFLHSACEERFLREREKNIKQTFRGMAIANVDCLIMCTHIHSQVQCVSFDISRPNKHKVFMHLNGHSQWSMFVDIMHMQWMSDWMLGG